MNDRIKKIYSLASHAGLKLGLAGWEAMGPYCMIRDRELYDMISQAQTLCLKICAHIQIRSEVGDEDLQQLNRRILKGEL